MNRRGVTSSVFYNLMLVVVFSVLFTYVSQPKRGGHSSFRLPLPVGKNLGLAVREDQCQFAREPLAVVEDFCAVLFLFFPMTDRTLLPQTVPRS